MLSFHWTVRASIACKTFFTKRASPAAGAANSRLPFPADIVRPQPLMFSLKRFEMYALWFAMYVMKFM